MRLLELKSHSGASLSGPLRFDAQVAEKVARWIFRRMSCSFQGVLGPLYEVSPPSRSEVSLFEELRAAPEPFWSFVGLVFHLVGG